MMVHPVFRAMGPAALLLLSMAGLPQQAQAQQVSLESLKATAGSRLAAARAGEATADPKMRLEEKELEVQAARDRVTATAQAPVPATPSTTPPAPAEEPAPPQTSTVEIGPDSDAGAVADMALAGEAAPGGDAGARSSPEDSTAGAGASSDRLNTLLPAPVMARAIARAETAAHQVDAMALEPATAAGVPGATAEGRTGQAGILDPATAALPLTDRVGATLESGLAGTASITSDWTTLVRDRVEWHPGLMPALLLLMSAAGATALAVGVGIRPGRRGRATVGHEGDPSAPSLPPPPRMRPDQRVPRDVAAVLASLEGRRGTPPLSGRYPRNGTTTATRRQG